MPSIAETVAAQYDKLEGAADEAPEAEVAEVEAAEPAEVEAGPVDDATEEGEESAGDSRVRDDRARDELGKFAKAKKTSAKAAPPQAPAEGAKTGEVVRAASPVQPVVAPVPGVEAIKAPASMTLQEREAFAKAPPEVQRFLDRREKDQSKVVAESAEARKIYARLEQVVGPHQEFFRRAGGDPFQTMGQVIQHVNSMYYGTPEQQAQAFAHAIRASKANIDLLDKYLAGQGPAPQEGQHADPVAAARQAAREEYQQMVAEGSRRQQEQKRQAFASSHEWLQDERLGPQVRGFMDTALAQGIAKDDESAYAVAIAAHPEIAPVEQQKKAAKAVTTAQAATAQAKAASSSVKGRPGLQMDGPKPKGIRGAVEAAMDALERRGA